jgi:hypothetical protein
MKCPERLILSLRLGRLLGLAAASALLAFGPIACAGAAARGPAVARTTGATEPGELRALTHVEGRVTIASRGPVQTQVLLFPRIVGACFDQAPPPTPQSIGLDPVARARTDADGAFEMKVPPGDYTFFTEHGGVLAPLAPAPARSECNPVTIGGDVAHIPEALTTLEG